MKIKLKDTMVREAKEYAYENGYDWFDVYSAHLIWEISRRIATDEKLYKKLKEKFKLSNDNKNR